MQLLYGICVKAFFFFLSNSYCVFYSCSFKSIEVHAQPVYLLAGVISLSLSSGL